MRCEIKLFIFYLFYLFFIPRNMRTVFDLLCFVVVTHWLIFPYPSGLLHWHCGNLTIAPVPLKHPWWIWINTSCEFIMNDCITTTKQSTTKPCAYFLGYTVHGKNAHYCTQYIPNKTCTRFCLFLFFPFRLYQHLLWVQVMRHGVANHEHSTVRSPC